MGIIDYGVGNIFKDKLDFCNSFLDLNFYLCFRKL